jgi:hypothetical protein
MRDSVIFSEKALIRWRSTFKTDRATRFSEVAGGLNQMTIAKFEAVHGFLGCPYITAVPPSWFMPGSDKRK